MGSTCGWVQASGDGRGPGQWGSQRGFLGNEHAVWMGDLNYRLTIPDEQVPSRPPSVACTLYAPHPSFNLDASTEMLHVLHAGGKAHTTAATSQIGRALSTASYPCLSVCMSVCFMVHVCSSKLLNPLEQLAS